MKETRQYYVVRNVQARGLYPNSTHYPEGRSTFKLKRTVVRKYGKPETLFFYN
jgi:hypothetical protein